MVVLSMVLLSGQLVAGWVDHVDFRILAPARDGEMLDEPRFPSTEGSRSPATLSTEALSAPTGARADKRNTEVARGFGTDIPLGFAARQIVPSRLQVTYGAGVRPEDRVSWTGGNPWNRVLQDAIRPLGLRMTVTGTVVSITR